MENVHIPPEYVQDPPALNEPQIADIVGRDPERTPMQWDASPNAGFTVPGVRPWLPIASDYPDRNVAREAEDPASMLNLYRALARLRRMEPALHAGDYSSLDVGPDEVFAYMRTARGAPRFLIVLNFGTNVHKLDLRQVAPAAAIAVGTDMRRSGTVALSALMLQPNEGLVLRL